MKKKIGIHGAVYGKNFGDILIIAILINCITKGNSLSLSIPYGLKRFTNYLQSFNINVKSRKIPNIMIFGPGGYLGEPKYNRLRWNLRFILYHGSLILACKILKLPVIIYGTGVGPISSVLPKYLLRMLFNSAILIHVRDYQSYEYVKKILPAVNEGNLSYGCDVALALEDASGIAPKSLNKNNGEIGIHMPVGKNISFPDVLASDIIDFVKSEPNTNFKILYDGPNQTTNLALRKLLELPNVVESKFNTPKDLLNQINDCSIILTSKLHVGICGYTLGKKIISIYTHDKNIRFFEQIKKPNNAIFIEDYSHGWLQSQIDKTRVDDNFHIEATSLKATARADLNRLALKLNSLIDKSNFN